MDKISEQVNDYALPLVTLKSKRNLCTIGSKFNLPDTINSCFPTEKSLTEKK